MNVREAIAVCLTTGLAAGCYEGPEQEGRSGLGGLDDRAGQEAGRWVLTDELSEISQATWVERNGSPPGKHKDSNCAPGQLAGTSVLIDYLDEWFEGLGHIGGYNCRPINHDYVSGQTSIHGMGRAIDISVPGYVAGSGNNAVGDPVAAWLIEHAEEIGVQQIIWDRSSWRADGSVQTRPYNSTFDHTDHLHVELNLEGAKMNTPWFLEHGWEQPPGEPGPQDGCPAPCWPDYALADYCVGGDAMRCEIGPDGCTALVQVEACGGESACFGTEGVADCCDGAFCDDDGTTFEGAIDRLADHGFVSGCGTKLGQPRFCPHDLATRAEVLAVVMRVLGVAPIDAPDAFDDDDGHWAEGHLNAAYALGITHGVSDRMFAPDEPATRTHVAAFIARGFQLPPPAADYFADDDDAPAWAQDAHDRLWEAGITSGCADDDAKPDFCGDDDLPRDQLAAFAWRAFDRVPSPYGG